MTTEHDDEVEPEPVSHVTGCCDQPHDEPAMPGGGEAWECPTTTGDYYIYCEWCDDWFSHWGRYVEYQFRGETLCETCFYDGTYSCDDCGDRFLDSDIRYDDRSDCTYCESCYEQNVRRRSEPSPRRRCATCGSAPEHLHGFSEEYLCDHLAARTKVAGKPVELAHVLPQSVWDEAVSWADTTGVKRVAVAR